MAGYQESVTDPSLRRPGHHLHLPARRQLRRQRGGDGVRPRVGARRWSCAQAHNREDAPAAERGWLDWLRDAASPAITGRRHARARPPHPRRGRDARRRLPGRGRRGAGARARRGRAADGGPRPGPRGHARAGRPSTATARRGSTPSTPASRARSSRHLVARGAQVTLHPCSVDRRRAAGHRRRRWSSWPTAPATPPRSATSSTTVRELVGKRPVWGICLGHQLLCQAVGLETYKLPFGHRGANHPVKDLATGRIEITSQNHGFAVTAPDGAARLDTDEPVRWETDFGDRRAHATSTSTTAPSRGCACSTSPARRSSTTPRPARARTTPATSSTASWPPPADAPPRRPRTRSSSSARGRSSSARRPSSTTPACRPARSCARRATRSSWSTRTRRRS